MSKGNWLCLSYPNRFYRSQTLFIDHLCAGACAGLPDDQSVTITALGSAHGGRKLGRDGSGIGNGEPNTYWLVIALRNGTGSKAGELCWPWLGAMEIFPKADGTHLCIHLIRWRVTEHFSVSDAKC